MMVTVRADLARLLAGYAPDDPGESAAATAIRTLLPVEGSFSSGHYAPGHITASAFVIHPREPAVALILHSKLQRWLQPGGHVEPHDPSIAGAALREVAEEIGVGAATEPWLCDLDVHVFPERPGTPQHLHHDVRVAFVADSVDLVVGDGADDVRWWTFERALELERSIARPAAKLAEWWAARN